ncbi:hypothetical protein Tco_0792237 [Tanacetum coccineum]
MSTSKTYQQSLADAGSETRPPMLEKGSYIPWVSRFRRCINRKRENRKWLNKALDEGPYQFQMFVPTGSTLPTLQTAEDLQGDELLHYDAKIKLMNLILLSIPNEIYNSVDDCATTKEMWKRVERLMRGNIQNQIDRETRFTNKFDQFVAEPGEALVYVYNRFAQLMNDLERNKMIFPIVTVNTKFLNSLQPEWLKYVTQVLFATRLTVDSFDDLFDYLQQFEKLVNASWAKKLKKSHDPLALVAHTGSSSRNTLSYYVTHPTSVVDYDDEYQQDDVQTNFEDPLTSVISSNTRNQAIIQGDMVNIQSRNPGNTGRNTRLAYVQEEVVEGSNAQNETGNVQRTLRTSSSGNTSTIQCYNYSGKGHYARNYPKPRVRDSKYFMEQMMEEIEELSVNICLMAKIQPADTTSDAGPSYDSAFISEVQSSSIKDNQEQMYPTHTKIINSTIGDDQIDSNIIFDEPNGNVNSGSVEKDTHFLDRYALEQLARNAYQEAEKQQLFAQKVQQQNMTLSSQLELYKERVRVLENIKGDNNYLNEFLEAIEYLCSCMQNVLIPCHDKCLAKYKLNVHSNDRRALSTNSRTPTSSDTTYVVLKTRFSEKLTQSKSLDTTSVVSKPKIVVGSASKAKHKVSSASKTKKRNLRDNSLSIYMKNKIQTSRIWQKWFESQPNVVWSPVNTTPNVHNSRSSEKPHKWYQSCTGDL